MGRGGMPHPCRGWKSAGGLGKDVCVCPCVCVRVCVHCEQKAQMRDTESKEMHDLLTALWCVLPQKKESKEGLM